MASVYIVHGYTASSTQNWFPWLREKLGERGVRTVVLDMPDSSAPRKDKWDSWLDQHIEEYDEETVFAGHSLGCVSLLRFLNRQDEARKVRGIVLVSGFTEPVPTLPMLNPFLEDPINSTKIIRMAKCRTAFTAPNDRIVPSVYTERMAKILAAELRSIENGGHFLDREGFTMFPQVYDEICRMIFEV